MTEFLPFLTNDNSIGLYSKSDDDVFHSAFGALSEAYEKFVLPLNLKQTLSYKTELNVLDICYGIGYNSKALINEFIKYSEPKNKLKIDCVDIDETLIKLSAFIKSKISFPEKFLYKKQFYKNVSDIKSLKNITCIKNKKPHPKFYLDKNINKIILRELIKSFDDIFDENLKNIVLDNDNFVFFDKAILEIYQFLSILDDKLPKNDKKFAFLHNIYYRYVSCRYKYFNKSGTQTLKSKLLDYPRNKNIEMSFYPQDIRSFIKSVDTAYDIIMLDGFTPQKCPCIWTEDFFIELTKKMNKSSVLVTYNHSVVIRSALQNSGLYIGNIFDNNNMLVGTIASKDKALIQNELSSKQQGLLKTKAGIPFRDKDLVLKNSDIIKNRHKEVSESLLESSSSYLKRCDNEV